MTDDERDAWQLRLHDCAWRFGRESRDLHRGNPFEGLVVLDNLMKTLMTEFWDNGFSQTEIRTAFERAIADMPRYAAGLEKRSDGPY